MKFRDLELLVTVSKCVIDFDPTNAARRWRCATIVRDKHTELSGDVFFPWTTDETVAMVIDHRKTNSKQILAQIASVHGMECFWKHRNKGPCSEDVEGGHVVARSAGAGDLTVENGMIECSAHNRQRGTKTIEEYLKSEERTP